MAAVGIDARRRAVDAGPTLGPNSRGAPGEQSLQLLPDLSELCRTELAWGSHLLLTATSAATILVAWDGTVVLRRGLVPEALLVDDQDGANGESFTPGPICERAQRQGQLVSLVKTALYPGRTEFDPVLPGLPSVMVQPLGNRGWVVLGGWSERCFSRSDERWFTGWCERLRTTLETNGPSPALTDA